MTVYGETVRTENRTIRRMEIESINRFVRFLQFGLLHLKTNVDFANFNLPSDRKVVEVGYCTG